LSSGSVPVIFNASAGSKLRLTDDGTTPESVRDLFARHGVSAQVVATKSSADARRAARDAVRSGQSTVVAAGGDGTVGDVATELLDSDVALGILPMGSVMNIPRMLGLPREADAAAAIIAAGHTRKIDVGEANGVVFYEAASVGMNAAIFREAQHFEAGDYGSPLRMLWVAFRYRPARMTLYLDDGQIRSRALMTVVSNGPYTGLGMTVAPGARLDDGRFDVVVFRHFSKFELLRHLASIAFGRRSYTPHDSRYRSASVRIESRRPLPCRADANDLGTTPLECRVRQASLRVIVEAGPAAGRPG
jgi:diacylglycerol kinase (ATP)